MHMYLSKLSKYLLVSIAVIILVGGGVLTWQFWSRASLPVSTTSIDVTQQEQNNLLTTDQDVKLPSTVSLAVKWLATPQEISMKSFPAWLGLTGEPAKKIKSAAGEWPEFYIGTVVGGKYDGYDVLRSTMGCELGCGGGIFLANRSTHALVILDMHGRADDYFEVNPLVSYASHETAMIIPDIIAPEKLDIVSPRATLILGGGMFGTGFAPALIADKAWLDTMQQVGVTTSNYPVYKDKANNHGCLYVVLPDHEVYTYNLFIAFYDQERIPRLTWSDGTYNTSGYQHATTSGCGSLNCLALVQEKDLVGRIIADGKTATGDVVYVLKNPTDQELKDMYDQWYVYNGKKSSYEDFVKMRPIFYWKDIFGDWVKWSNSVVMPQAECGKPVIYLYPTKSTNVDVKLNFVGEITKSIPEYINGWSVLAEPNGTLTNQADGQTYPYLYWDGVGPTYPQPTTGVVLAAANVEAYLMQSLSTLGLTQKEAVDFKEFWLPILKRSPYARISFMDQAVWKKAAPLAVSPEPDHVLRIFMDWQPLNQPVAITPQVLAASQPRHGFSVVEWGGLLYNP